VSAGRRTDLECRSMKPLVFISCGQVSPEEIALGKAIYQVVEADGRYEPYFAENQSSLEGVTENILTKLASAEAFVAVIHPRGEVIAPGRLASVRASVWIEQEIAILAALAQVYRKTTKVQVYTKKGVVREGLRTFVMANPVEFEHEEEVVTHFRSVFPSWDLQLQARALAAAEEELLSHSADSGEIQILMTDQTGEFVRAGPLKFVDPKDRSVAVRYVDALRSLESRGMARQIKPTLYQLTSTGFARARSLERDPRWLIIQPVVTQRWPNRAQEPSMFQLRLRNAGSIKPKDLRVVLRFPRKWLTADDSASGSADFIEIVRDTQFFRDNGFLDRLYPGKFDRTIVLEVPYWIPFPRAGRIDDIVEIVVSSGESPQYLSRFVLEQLFDEEPGEYCVVTSTTSDGRSEVIADPNLRYLGA
jgi:hypothetical protein